MIKLKKWSVLASVCAVLLVTGCSKSINVRMLEPAEIDRAASTKRIAVSEFKRDTVGLAGKIESRIASSTLDGELFFTAISRSDVDKLLREQKLQYSGVLDDTQAVEVGELLGAQAMITGEVSSTDSADTTYIEMRSQCADKDCKKLRQYPVPCTKRSVSMGATIKMTDVSKGDIIHAQSYTKHQSFRTCIDSGRTLPTRSSALETLANAIASDFVSKLKPRYRTVEVELLEDPDIDYSREQKKTLEVALEFIEAKRLDKAEKFLGTLLEDTQDRSYVAAYNLGVVKEAQGDYGKAQQLYQLADDLQTKPVEAINKAVVRIREAIRKRDQAQLQISK